MPKPPKNTLLLIQEEGNPYKLYRSMLALCDGENFDYRKLHKTKEFPFKIGDKTIHKITIQTKSGNEIYSG